MDYYHSVQEWNFDTPVEQERHRRIIAAVRQRIGPEPWGDIFELGCSEGAFTSRLVRLGRSVTACDVSAVACAKSSKRFIDQRHIRIQRLDCIRQDISGEYDLIFAMDVLEMIYGRRRVDAVISKLLNALRPGGMLIFSGCLLPEYARQTRWARRLLLGADNQLSCLLRCGLQLVHREDFPEAGRRIPGYPDHVIALLRKQVTTVLGPSST